MLSNRSYDYISIGLVIIKKKAQYTSVNSRPEDNSRNLADIDSEVVRCGSFIDYYWAHHTASNTNRVEQTQKRHHEPDTPRRPFFT